MDYAPVTFRLGYGRWLAGIVILVAATGVAGFVVSGDYEGLSRYVWPVILLGVLGWALFWQPRLTVEEHAITVDNVFRSFVVPWPALQSVDTKYALTLFTTIGKIEVWATPAPGRHVSSSATLGSVGHIPKSMLGVGGSIRPGDLPSSDSGAAAYVIRSRYEELLESGRLASGVEPGAATVTVHVPLLVVLVALSLASALGALLP